MGNYIRKVKIQSLFEKNNNFVIEFIEKTNCIFGDNGTGKTTVINLIVATLNCDIKKISETPFESIEIYTAKRKTKRGIRAITVYKANDDEVRIIIGNDLDETFNSQIDPRLINKKRNSIINRLNELIQLSYVPLSRLNGGDGGYEIADDYALNRSLRARNVQTEEILDIIDPSRRMLNQIEKEFIDIYSNIQKKISEHTTAMKNNIVRRTLIDDEFIKKSDEFSRRMFGNKSIDSEKYNASEILSKFKQANIDIMPQHLEEHFKLWTKITTEFEEASAKYSASGKDDRGEYVRSYYRKFCIIVMFEKFMSILSDIEDLERKKSAYLKLFSNTKEVINDFFCPRKTFGFNAKGGFVVEAKGKSIEMANLSSGEKHLIALIGRVALSSGQASVFMADEPELSLHLEWQRPLINSMRKLAPFLQIIVATHSPAIIPSDSNQIDLEECRV